MLKIQTFPVNMVEENTYVVSDTSGEAAIIDCGALFPDEQEAILNYLDREQLKVVRLLQTHGHFDHIFGAQWATDTFGVEVEMHTDEKENYLRAVSDMQTFIRRKLEFPIPTPNKFFQDGDKVTFGTHTFEIILTPGHTPGGICFYCAEEKVLFSGDSLFRGNIGRCDLPGGDMQTLVQALQTRILTLPEDVMVYPGHGPTTTIGDERAHNPYL